MDWKDFADRLTVELSRLPVQSFLIVQGPGGLPYVQAMRTRNSLDAEAVGSAFLQRPLVARQEKRLKELGWNPPDERDRRNWWHRISMSDRTAIDEQAVACENMALRMAAAFRDVYAVRSPLELVYQASHEGGPLALPGLGIPLAIPEVVDEPEKVTGPELESALAAARERGDQQAYLDLLTDVVLYLPVPGSPTAQHHYATAQFGDGTFVLAFTSPEAMDHSLRGQAVHHRPARLTDLARDWPHPDWQLAINPGLPSAAYLDATHLHPSPPGRGAPTGTYDRTDIPPASADQADNATGPPYGSDPYSPPPERTPSPASGSAPAPYGAREDASATPPAAASAYDQTSDPRAATPGAPYGRADVPTVATDPGAAPRDNAPGAAYTPDPYGSSGTAARQDAGATPSAAGAAASAYGQTSPDPGAAPRGDAPGAPYSPDAYGSSGTAAREDAGATAPPAGGATSAYGQAGPAMGAASRDDAPGATYSPDPYATSSTGAREDAGATPPPASPATSAYDQTGMPDDSRAATPGAPYGRADVPTAATAGAEPGAAPRDDAPGAPYSPDPYATPGTGAREDAGATPSSAGAAASAYSQTGPEPGAVPRDDAPGAPYSPNPYATPGTGAREDAGATPPPAGTAASPYGRAGADSGDDAPGAVYSPGPYGTSGTDAGQDVGMPGAPSGTSTSAQVGATSHDQADMPTAGTDMRGAVPASGADAPGAAYRPEPYGTGADPGDVRVAGASGRPAAAGGAQGYEGAGLVVMQKVVRPEHVTHYLDGGYDRVAGYVHRLQDVAELSTPALLVRGLGLVYEGSPFSSRDDDIYVIRWPALKPVLFRRPYGGIDEWSMGIIPGGWVIEKAPFPGSGYAPGEGSAIPEFKVDSQRLPHGAEMYRLDASGRETLIAGFDADRGAWRRVEGR